MGTSRDRPEVGLAQFKPLFLYISQFHYIFVFLLFKGIGFFYIFLRHTPFHQDYYLVGRIVACMFGVITVYVVYRLVVFLFPNNKPVALFSSFLVVFSRLHIIQSRLATVDVILTFWVTLSFYFIVQMYYRKRKMFWPIFCSGVAASTKYTGFFTLLPMLLAISFKEDLRNSIVESKKLFIFVFTLIVLGLLFLLSVFLFPIEKIIHFATNFTVDHVLEREYISLIRKIPAIGLSLGFGCFIIAFFSIRFKNKSWIKIIVNIVTNRKIIASILLTLLVFSIISPFVVLNCKEMLRVFIYQYRRIVIGSAAAYPQDSRLYAEAVKKVLDKPWGGIYYFRLLKTQFGWIALFFVARGVIYLFSLSVPEALVFISFPALYTLTISFLKYQAGRYFLPVIPFASIFIGIGFLGFSRKIQQWSEKKRIPSYLPVYLNLILVGIIIFTMIQKNIIPIVKSFNGLIIN